MEASGCWFGFKYKTSDYKGSRRQAKNTQNIGKTNIPGGCLGPGQFIWGVSCHGVRLWNQTSWLLDTNHWES